MSGKTDALFRNSYRLVPSIASRAASSTIGATVRALLPGFTDHYPYLFEAMCKRFYTEQDSPNFFPCALFSEGV